MDSAHVHGFDEEIVNTGGKAFGAVFIENASGRGGDSGPVGTPGCDDGAGGAIHFRHVDAHIIGAGAGNVVAIDTKVNGFREYLGEAGKKCERPKKFVF